MGFFSYNCKCCGHPALCPAATTDINEWMTDVVVCTPDKNVFKGQYDGYGRVYGDDEELVLENVWDLDPQNSVSTKDKGFTLYHLACWVKAGQPGFAGQSKDAKDQGWFFNDEDHDMPCPL